MIIRYLYQGACMSICVIAIAACTSLETQPEAGDQNTLAMATQVLRDSRIRANPAVAGLMQQADALIENNDLDLAEDKIERALRISPNYAPGWSRLSRIALSRNDPARAVQMAKRSNSCAGDASELKRLNWRFIREARLSQNDDEGVAQADAAIRGLR
jgi:Tfp pilus assembly protein PilF